MTQRDRIAIGRIVKVHGLKGELVVESRSDVPDRFAPGTQVHVAGTPRTITSSRAHQGRLLVTFDGIADRTAAEALRGAELTAPPADVSDSDTFYAHELVGMAVVLEDEREGDRRRALNAGHTIGHAIESLARGDVRHGHAVAMGLVAECRAAAVDDAVTARVDALLRAIGAPTEAPTALRDPSKLWQLARHDKKAMRGSVPMFVPRRLGDGAVVELTEAGLQRAMTR